MVLMEVLRGFKRSNIENVEKPNSLMNYFIAVSTNQLEGNKYLDLMPNEKKFLKSKFKPEKHHIIVAMNIYLYFVRQ